MLKEKIQKLSQPIINSFGEQYAEASLFLAESNQPKAKQQATEAARRALDYFLKTKDYMQINSVLQDIALGPYDPYLWQLIIRKIEQILHYVPDGLYHHDMSAYLAGFYEDIGQYDKAVKLYQRAINGSKTLQDKAQSAWLYHHLANALTSMNELSQAKEMYQKCLKTQSFGQWGRLDKLSTELEILRIDILQGKVVETLPCVEKHIKQLRHWWQDRQAGKQIEGISPHDDSILQILVSSLDMLKTAYQALENWALCLKLSNEMLVISKEQEESHYTLQRIRFEKYPSLLQLNRLDEAQLILESCLSTFKAVDQPLYAQALSALALLWARRDDNVQAIGLERQALMIYQYLNDAQAEKKCHKNLKYYVSEADE